MNRAPELQLATRWVLETPPNPAAARELAAALGIPPALAGLLIQRRILMPDEAKAFLRPSLDALADPRSLAGMDEAVAAITDAVRRGDPILIHGDYDVDGQSSTALLTRVLREAGAEAIPFVPHRLRDGYDFGPAGLREAERVGAKLIITGDCGITAVDAVAAAAAAGIRVVVTDHHLPGPLLPPAAAVVNPQRGDDRSGLGVLCGTGIAFKLVQALVSALGLPPTLPLHFLDLVAIATIADVVPLVGENRILVRHGLRLLRRSRWPGLQALVRSAGLADRPIRAGQVGFILAPRLNAAGRVGEAMHGLRLLLTDDPAEAAALADRLNRYNEERQDLDAQILQEALDLVQVGFDPMRDAAFVLASEGWHPGVVGIVASRVVERYGRPTFLIGLDGDIGRGSGRSISRFDLHAALVECGDLLDRFGGHRMAAGVTVRRERLDAFRERFQEIARRSLDPETLGPEQRVDLELALEDITDQLERLCRHLEPCGMGNPAPVFGLRCVEFRDRQIVGQGHLKGWFEEPRRGRRVEAIGFELADRYAGLGAGPVHAALRLERNEYLGRSSLQARLLVLEPAESAPAPRLATGDS